MRLIRYRSRREEIVELVGYGDSELVERAGLEVEYACGLNRVGQVVSNSPS